VRTVGPVLGGIAAIAALGGVLWLAAVYVTDRQREDTPGFENRLGADAFEVPYDVLLERIERDGAPVLFPDLLVDGDLYIYVNHLGPGPQEGWVAFEAKRPGADLSCTLDWHASERQFVDPCTGETYPADGDGLRQFPTDIDEDGDLVVRLRPPDADTPSPTPPDTVPIVGD
jgi:hypothetical protein